MKHALARQFFGVETLVGQFEDPNGGFGRISIQEHTAWNALNDLEDGM